jgi:signal transduction histidine kinase
MDDKALRDHALGMLKDIVADLRTPQTDAEQSAKAKGKAPIVVGAAATAAEVHGAGRAESGFTVAEMVSEYRALRASVIRLWTKANGTLTGEDLDDLMRFNETIDQAMAESIERYEADIDRSKEMFLGILGHDLRSPLSAVITGSQFLLETNELSADHAAVAAGVVRSAKRMTQMVGDLLDFTRGRLGSGIPITRGDVDFGAVVRDAVEEIRAARPAATIQFNASGELRGRWDAARLGQLVGNLLGNAVQHGPPETMIGVTAEGERESVVLRVHNFGPPIPATELGDLFSPFKRVRRGEAPVSGSGSLGLGLYIVDRIVSAHGGTIDVRSSAAAGTLFTVRLPR